MKIIDLLNKIANGEEVPKKIKFGGIDYYYNEEYKTYKYDKNCELYKHTILGLCLNDEVEIIEEDKKIEKLKEYGSWSEDVESNCIQFLEIKQKINEIIDYINRGEK